MKSMTGYGKGVAAHDGRELTVELKSVNHRFLDIGMRVPRTLSCTEDTIRKVLSERLSRGHIDVFLNYRNTRTDAKTVRVDTQLLAAYVAAARSIPQSLDLPDDLTLTGALRLPDVTEIVTADEDAEALTALAKQATNAAVDALETMRHAEGERLKAALSAEVDQMAAYREQILARAPMVTEDYRKKLTERIEQVLSDAEIDRARLATEIALFADRACIDEVPRLSGNRRADRTQDGLFDSGNEPRMQYDRQQGKRCGADRDRAALQVRDRKAARADSEHRMSMKHAKLVSIGFGNLVQADRIVAIVAPDSAPVKRIIADARERNLLIDASAGRKTRAVLVMDSAHIILSGLQSETIANRLGADDSEMTTSEEA